MEGPAAKGAEIWKLPTRNEKLVPCAQQRCQSLLAGPAVTVPRSYRWPAESAAATDAGAVTVSSGSAPSEPPGDYTVVMEPVLGAKLRPHQVEGTQFIYSAYTMPASGLKPCWSATVPPR